MTLRVLAPQIYLYLGGGFYIVVRQRQGKWQFLTRLAQANLLIRFFVHSFLKRVESLFPYNRTGSGLMA